LEIDFWGNEDVRFLRLNLDREGGEGECHSPLHGEKERRMTSEVVDNRDGYPTGKCGQTGRWTTETVNLPGGEFSRFVMDKYS
jgi:hypothetical protein